jgi:hypothetical protein
MPDAGCEMLVAADWALCCNMQHSLPTVHAADMFSLPHPCCLAKPSQSDAARNLATRQALQPSPFTAAQKHSYCSYVMLPCSSPACCNASASCCTVTPAARHQLAASRLSWRAHCTAALPQLVQREAKALLQSHEAANGLALAAQYVLCCIDELRQEAALAVSAAVGVPQGCCGVSLGVLDPLVHRLGWEDAIPAAEQQMRHSRRSQQHPIMVAGPLQSADIKNLLKGSPWVCCIGMP